MAKKYSVDEIDRMRQLIAGSYPSGVGYRPTERDADVENRLRTYMLNGSTVAELEAMREAHFARERERYAEHQRIDEMLRSGLMRGVTTPEKARS